MHNDELKDTKLYKQYNNSIIIQINLQSKSIVFPQDICNSQFGLLFGGCSLYNVPFQRTSQIKTRMRGIQKSYKYKILQ